MAVVAGAPGDMPQSAILSPASPLPMLSRWSRTTTSRLIIEALFDIRTELRRIVVLLKEDDGEQGDEEADS